MESNVITFFDLFSGVGGFRLALEKVGWKCVGYCEIDKYAKITYEANFKTLNEQRYSNVRDVNTEELPDFDVLVAGFPCQTFSFAGKRLGLDDVRGTLFFEIIRFIKAKKPKVFLLENVKGLVCHNNGKTISMFIEALKELGYDIHYQVLNSKNFEVPQNRERIFFVGFRMNERIHFEFPEGIQLTKKLKDIMEDKVPEKYYLDEKGIQKYLFQKNVGNGSTDIVLLSHTKANIKKRRQNRNESWTLDTSGNKIGIIEGKRIRRFTPREYARLQGFPDLFVFPVSDTQAYKQIGNAVTVTVIEAIVHNLEKWIWWIDYKQSQR